MALGCDKRSKRWGWAPRDDSNISVHKRPIFVFTSTTFVRLFCLSPNVGYELSLSLTPDTDDCLTFRLRPLKRGSVFHCGLGFSQQPLANTFPCNAKRWRFRLEKGTEGNYSFCPLPFDRRRSVAQCDTSVLRTTLFRLSTAFRWRISGFVKGTDWTKFAFHRSFWWFKR